MAPEHTALATPPAVVALRRYPLLLAGVEASIQRQVALIQSYKQQYIERQALSDELELTIVTLEQGLITLEGPPGSGVSALLAHLATTREWAFWFGNADYRQGPSALAAQLIALYELNMPLIPPALQHDPTALSQFLTDTVAQLAPSDRLVLVIDPPAAGRRPTNPYSSPLPTTIPERVIVIYGCPPDTPLPIEPAARITLPQSGEELVRNQARMLNRNGCPPVLTPLLLSIAKGNPLAARLTHGLLQQRLLTVQQVARNLRPGLDAIYTVWWEHLDRIGRRLACFLAAADEPLPHDLSAALLETDPRPWLQRWQQMGFVWYSAEAASYTHESIAAYIQGQQAESLAQVHTEIAVLALAAYNVPDAPINAEQVPQAAYSSPRVMRYLLRHFARHAALGTTQAQADMLPLIGQRFWVRLQERQHDQLDSAAYDVTWELEQAAQRGPLLRLVRSAALGSTLISLSRTIAPDAATAALRSAVEQHGREPGLRRVRQLIDQLPDVQSKGLILRQLGEVAHELKMRSAAMRLLSQALDLEDTRVPVAWVEQREQLYSELAQTALQHGDVDIAQTISARIEHIERRAVVETQIVRWLINQAVFTQARKMADTIEHENMRSWSLAEIAAAQARTGNMAAAEALLATIDSETARSWGEIEIACDLARENEVAARQRIDQLDSSNQHDRGLAQLARALALIDKDGDALDAAVQIQDVAVRVATLLDLRLMLEGLVAMLALEQATRVIGELPRDIRVPLVAMLASSYAALGRSDQALQVANDMVDGEERTRALSRVAVAMAQRGDYAQGLEIAQNLADDDERDWTFDELVNVLAEAGRWDEARLLTEQLNSEQRPQTQANLAIALARAEQPLPGLELAYQIQDTPGEFARAVNLIAPFLVSQRHSDVALNVVRLPQLEPTEQVAAAKQQLSPLQRSRYIATVATALAEQGDLDAAQRLVATIRYPLDQARTRLAIAQAALDHEHDNSRAIALLGQALQGMLLGRDEAYKLLGLAVPLLVALGGPTLLQDVAAAIDEVDHL